MKSVILVDVRTSLLADVCRVVASCLLKSFCPPYATVISRLQMLHNAFLAQSNVFHSGWKVHEYLGFFREVVSRSLLLVLILLLEEQGPPSVISFSDRATFQH